MGISRVFVISNPDTCAGTRFGLPVADQGSMDQGEDVDQSFIVDDVVGDRQGIDDQDAFEVGPRFALVIGVATAGDRSRPWPG